MTERQTAILAGWLFGADPRSMAEIGAALEEPMTERWHPGEQVTNPTTIEYGSGAYLRIIRANTTLVIAGYDARTSHRTGEEWYFVRVVGRQTTQSVEQRLLVKASR